jgi:hypothetical protein
MIAIAASRTPQAALPSAVSHFWAADGPAIEAALALLEAEARRQRDTFGNESGARAIGWATAEIRAVLQAGADELLTLTQAALRAGYSEDHLSRLVRQGRIPDLREPPGRGPIRIRARDLPIKPAAQQIPGADAHGLASRPSGGTEGHHGR